MELIERAETALEEARDLFAEDDLPTPEAIRPVRDGLREVAEEIEDELSGLESDAGTVRLHGSEEEIERRRRTRRAMRDIEPEVNGVLSELGETLKEAENVERRDRVEGMMESLPELLDELEARRRAVEELREAEEELRRTVAEITQQAAALDRKGVEYARLGPDPFRRLRRAVDGIPRAVTVSLDSLRPPTETGPPSRYVHEGEKIYLVGDWTEEEIRRWQLRHQDQEVVHVPTADDVEEEVPA